MIIIISRANDQSTDDVLNWINHLFPHQKLVRINKEDSFLLKEMDLDDFTLVSSTSEIKFSEIQSVWYRRGDISLEVQSFSEEDEVDNELFKKVESFLRFERNSVMSFIHTKLFSKKSLNSFLNASLNKQTVLLMARNYGLKVPATVITSYKTEVLKFLTQYPESITKTINHTFGITVDRDSVACYTEDVTKRDLKKMPPIFPLSLIQQKLKKKYEIRVFYLGSKFYSMAIFSQADTQTQTDFRHYNHTKPNRMVPYLLPESIERKLDVLMKELKLTSGSIDIIVTPDLEHFFLEVNPIGQFGMTSLPCNYYLEKCISEYLCQK
ncbi:MAG: grasp-with-spasm system ATP-grasp peptide maturase [Bacteroidia bacterium]